MTRWALIDIDGTISPLRIDREHGDPIYVPGGMSGSALVPSWMPALLFEIHELGIRLAWYTSWQEDAVEFVQPALHLPDMPVVPMSDLGDGAAQSKALGLASWDLMDPADSYVVLDDEIDDTVRALWPDNVADVPIDSLWGLRPEMVSDVLAAFGVEDPDSVRAERSARVRLRGAGEASPLR